MIHEAYLTTEVAYRYYKLVKPDRNYNRDQARKQFAQDSNIDKKALKKVYRTIFLESTNGIK